MKKIIMLTFILFSISMNMQGSHKPPAPGGVTFDYGAKAKSDFDNATATVEKLSNQLTTLPKQIADLTAQLEAIPKQLEAAKEVLRKAEEEYKKWIIPEAREARY